MPALSTKDKLKLRLSAAKVERWNRERQKPAKNFEVTASGKVKPVERCRVVWAPGQDKPDIPVESRQDGLDSVHRVTDGHKMRLSAGKLTLVRRGDNFSDYGSDSVVPSPAKDLPKVATPRPDSPFKRSGKAVANVVIVRKGKPV